MASFYDSDSATVSKHLHLLFPFQVVERVERFGERVHRGDAVKTTAVVEAWDAEGSMQLFMMCWIYFAQSMLEVSDLHFTIAGKRR